MNTNFAVIEKFLNNRENLDYIEESLALIWIDWRDYDEDIISYFSENLALDIQVENVDRGKEYGDDIVLKLGNKTMEIPYEEVMDRDTTIIYLNEFLKPDYEIRWFMESLGGDTLAFTVLREGEWKVLKSSFGSKLLDYYFEPINIGKRMFDMSMGEVFKLLDMRNK